MQVKYAFQKSTRFADLNPLAAGFVIFSLVVLVAYGLMIYKSMRTGIEDANKQGADLKCQRRIIERIHAGDGYYTAAGDELRSRGYTTGSVFNWRLPVFAWLMGRLPSIHTGQVFAVILASVTLLIWISVFQRNGCSLGQLMLGTLVLLEATIYSLSTEVFLIHEFWAGTLISLSLAAYARDWRLISIACGLMALFLRELTLPFIGVMMALSYLEGRRREALVWFFGIVAFGIELLFHGLIVKNLITTGDLVLKEGWIVFGGWRYVLSTAQMHLYLLLLPSRVTAIVLPLALLGLAGWRGPLGSRVASTVGIYVLAYLFVGRPVNQLWGLMYTGVMLLGLFYSPSSLRDLWQSICKKPKRSEIEGSPSASPIPATNTQT